MREQKQIAQKKTTTVKTMKKRHVLSKNKMAAKLFCKERRD